MWESRRDSQRAWEGWEAGIMALHAFHTLSFPWSAFRPAMLGEGVRHPATKHLWRPVVCECIGDLALVQTHSPPRSALDLLAKNQGHIASGVLQQLLARNTGLGAKLQTLHQVNERTASHLGRGCAS